MPNHIHGIIMIMDDDNQSSVGARHASPLPVKRHDLGDIVGSLKSAVSQEINDIRKTPGASVWQRSYHDHIIRNEQSLNRIREYIITNPLQWQYDKENNEPIGGDTFDEWLQFGREERLSTTGKPGE